MFRLVLGVKVSRPKYEYPNVTKELLLNLAYRLRLARKNARRHEKPDSTSYLELWVDAQRLEAWNSYQAAKALVTRERTK